MNRFPHSKPKMASLSYKTWIINIVFVLQRVHRSEEKPTVTTWAGITKGFASIGWRSNRTTANESHFNRNMFLSATECCIEVDVSASQLFRTTKQKTNSNSFVFQNHPKGIRSSVRWSIRRWLMWTNHNRTMPMRIEFLGLLTESIANRKFIRYCEISSWYEQNESQKCSQRWNLNWFRGVLCVDIVFNHSARGDEWKWLCVTDQRHESTTTADFPHE